MDLNLKNSFNKWYGTRRLPLVKLKQRHEQKWRNMFLLFGQKWHSTQLAHHLVLPSWKQRMREMKDSVKGRSAMEVVLQRVTGSGTGSGPGVTGTGDVPVIGSTGSGTQLPQFGGQNSSGSVPGVASQRPFAMTSEGKLPYGVNLPTPDFKSWKSRHSELLGYRSWLESFLSWLALMSESFPPEVKEALQSPVAVTKAMLNQEQQVRGLRLLSFLRQCFSAFPKVDGIISHYVSTTVEGEAHGYEAFRRIHTELSLQSRAEVMAFRDQTLKFRSRDTSLVDIIRSVDVELYQFDMRLSDWNIPSTVPRQEALAMRTSLAISEADRTMILLRSVPEHIRIHVSLHHRVNMERYSDLRTCLLEYDVSTRVLGDVSGKLASLDSKGKGKARKAMVERKESQVTQLEKEKATQGKVRKEKGTETVSKQLTKFEQELWWQRRKREEKNRTLLFVWKRRSLAKGLSLEQEGWRSQRHGRESAARI